MKIKILIEDKKKGKIIIPINKENLHNLFDITFMLGHNKDEYETLKLNKCEDTWKWFCNTIHYMSDIVYDGKCYSIKKGINPKKPLTKKDFVLCKERDYHIRRPKWKKKN